MQTAPPLWFPTPSSANLVIHGCDSSIRPLLLTRRCPILHHRQPPHLALTSATIALLFAATSRRTILSISSSPTSEGKGDRRGDEECCSRFGVCDGDGNGVWVWFFSVGNFLILVCDGLNDWEVSDDWDWYCFWMWWASSDSGFPDEGLLPPAGDLVHS
ncbi:hypothetical protein Droror1_Dr00003168 [Drosera rotundifolia]